MAIYWRSLFGDQWRPIQSLVMSQEIMISVSLLFLLCGFASALDLPSAVVDGSVPDWLINDVTTPVTLDLDKASGLLTLRNGLIERVFTTAPDIVTIDFYSRSSLSSLFRAVSPEAQIILDTTAYDVGSIVQTSEFAFANRTAFTFTRNPTAFASNGVYHISAPVAQYNWTAGSRGGPLYLHWPPNGLHVAFDYIAPASAPPHHRLVNVSVHYEMYEGIPALAKWVTIQPVNTADAVNTSVTVNGITVETLRLNRPFSPVVFSSYPTAPPTINSDILSRLYVTTSEAHGAQVLWDNDDHIHDTPGAAEPTLNVTTVAAPGFVVDLSSANTAAFVSLKTFELVTDSVEMERHGLSVRALTRLTAPATTENPIFMHLTDASSAGIRSAVDQAVDVGFEMIILSFGTSFDIENNGSAYLAQMKSDIAYANEHGIEVGGYDLISLTRDVGPEWDEIDPATGKADGNACFASGWYDHLSELVFNFVQVTGLSAIETDGPYAGTPCASTTHSHHIGVSDSIYQQTKFQSAFYTRLRAVNVYIHQPDNYFYAGGSKTAMGYNENQYSLPRWTDLSVSRAGYYVDTYTKLVTQGWMFVPLVDYHGGGDAAAFEPLSQHLVEYEWALAQYLGAGIAACYRGNRLYDTNVTRALVTKWVDFYKRHRPILISDIVHLKAPDLQDIDYFIHQNYRHDERALMMIFNPTPRNVTNRMIHVPLYYTGLNDTVWIQQEEDAASGSVYTLDRLYHVTINVTIPAQSVSWMLFTKNPTQANPTATAI